MMMDEGAVGRSKWTGLKAEVRLVVRGSRCWQGDILCQKESLKGSNSTWEMRAVPLIRQVCASLYYNQ